MSQYGLAKYLVESGVYSDKSKEMLQRHGRQFADMMRADGLKAHDIHDRGVQDKYEKRFAAANDEYGLHSGHSWGGVINIAHDHLHRDEACTNVDCYTRQG